MRKTAYCRVRQRNRNATRYSTVVETTKPHKVSSVEVSSLDYFYLT